MSHPPANDPAAAVPAAPPEKQDRMLARDYRLVLSGVAWGVIVIVLVALLQNVFKEWYSLHALRSYRSLTRLEAINATRILSHEAGLKKLLQDRADPQGVPSLFFDLAIGLHGPDGLAQLERELANATPGLERSCILAGLEYGQDGRLAAILGDADADMALWLDAVQASALVDVYTAIDFNFLINGPYINLFPGKKEISAQIRESFPNHLNRILNEQDEETDPVTGAIRSKSDEMRAFLAQFPKDNPQIYKEKARAKWLGAFEATVAAQFKRRDSSLGYKRLIRTGTEARRGHLDGAGWAIVNRCLAEKYLANTADLRPAAVPSGPDEVEAHAGPVLALARSPTSGAFATAGLDNRIRIWSPELNGPAQTLEGHTFGVMAVAWSPNGRSLASCGLDGTIRIWDAETLQATAQFPAATNRAAAIAYAPDGRTLAVAGTANSVRLIEAATGTELRRLTGLKGEITSLAYSPGGRYLVAGSRDMNIRVWDLRGGDAGNDTPATELPEKINTLTLAHKASVWNVAISPDGQFIATAADDGLGRIFNLRRESTSALSLKGHRLPVTAVAWSPDSMSCASIGNDGRVILWSPTSNTPRSMHRFGNVVLAAAFSADGKRLVAACEDGRLRQWIIVDGQIETRTFSEWVTDSFSK